MASKLRQFKKMGAKTKEELFLFYFYVPFKAKERVKTACFMAGAGKVGFYTECSFEYSGQGQFRPLEGSKPFIGKKLTLSKVKEVKVEIIVQKKYLKKTLVNFLKSHPYEEPAFGFIKILNS